MTPFGRRLLVERIVVLGWRPIDAAAAAGVSTSTAYKWVRRWRAEGPAGLEDRSCRPHRSPRRLPAELEQQVLAARAATKHGPHRLAWQLGIPRSTVYAVLRRHRVSRLDHVDRPSGAPIRYQACHPGSLIHVDVKKLGRIPDGGGWRVHGRSEQVRGRGIGYDYVHVAVDDRSRVAYAEIHDDERGTTVAGFLGRVGAFFATRGVAIERIMTDNAFAYRHSRAVADVVTDLGARQVFIRPHRPQTNGKVERFNRTLKEEWAYVRAYDSNPARAAALDTWLHDYNHHRPHWSLDGSTPMHVIENNVPEKHS